MRYIPEFDSLRAFAVLVVMIYHDNKNVPELHLFPVFRHGYLGVDLFFVLSGYLITRILLSNRGEQHFFRNFYLRRALRIWPLYFAILLVTFAVLPNVGYGDQVASNCRPIAAYFLFIQNLFPHAVGVGPVTVTWSLAIEEQFYLLWPLLVFYLDEAALKRLCFAVIVASPFVRMALSHYWSWDYIYRFTPTRIDGLAAGCILAMTAFHVRTAKILACSGIAITALSLYMGLTSFVSFGSLVLFSGVLIAALKSEFIPTSTSLRYLGKISYGLYLLHVPTFDVLRRFMHPSGIAYSMGFFVLSMGLSVCVASISWYCIEKPVLELKSRIRPARPATIIA